MSQKASLSLSVNAIVVLILAIVMLGLGIAFIKGMFGQVQTSFEQQVVSEPDPTVPSLTNPITLSRESIITNADKIQVIKIGVLNPTNGSWTNAQPQIICKGIVPTVATMDKDLAANEVHVYATSIKMPNAGANLYLCQVNITAATAAVIPSYVKDFSIEVRNK